MEIKKNKKQKEGSSLSIRDKVNAIPAVAMQHLPDGTKHEVRKKAGRLKNQAAVQEMGSSDVPIPNKKILQSEEKKSDHNKYFYVYGITNNKNIKLDFEGLKNQPIQRWDINDITVLFSFYPTLHPLIEEKEALLHAEILNKLAGKINIVPMAFGTVFKDQEILKIVLTKSYLSVKKTLELIKNKIELGVKVVKKEGVPGEANQEILEELSKLSVQSVMGDKFSERLLLNNSFLVERYKFTQFSDKVEELEQRYQDLKFIYTGPWPAYSFVNININAG